MGSGILLFFHKNTTISLTGIALLAFLWEIAESFVLVQYNQRGNHARHPAAKREQKHDEHRAAAAVDHRQGREKDGKEDSEEGHNFLGLLFEKLLFIENTISMPFKELRVWTMIFRQRYFKTFYRRKMLFIIGFFDICHEFVC